jgi:hypothetical protein
LVILLPDNLHHKLESKVAQVLLIQYLQLVVVVVDRDFLQVLLGGLLVEMVTDQIQEHQ